MTTFLRKLALLLRRDRFRAELDEEMAFHRAEAERTLLADGMAAKAARRSARRQFGSEAKLREQSHEAVAFRLESVGQDLRYALRQMQRAPGFTLAVVLTLALGIGANTAIFSVVRATLLRPLPFPEGDRIVRITDQRTRGESTGGLVGVLRFYDLKERTRSLDSAAFFFFDPGSSLIVGKNLPESVDGAGASGQFWRVLGVRPLLGRTFDERDDRPHAPQVAVLGYGLWQRSFGGDPGAIGKAILVDKQPATVIGVMPRGFDYPGTTEIWTAAQFDAGSWNGYRGDGARFLNVLARLKPGVSLMAASNELSTLSDQLAREHSETDGLWRFHAVSLRESLFGAVRPALLVLMAASSLLLLIACVNVANLLLSRATAREREVALRQALGASRARIARQLLTESLLLAASGGAAGLGAAWILTSWANRLPGALPTTAKPELDLPVAAFALAVSTVAGLLFGVAPVWQSMRGRLNRSLKSGESRVAGGGGNRLRSAFIAVQVALSMILLVGACLLAESLWKLTQSPLGFEPERLLLFHLVLPWNSNPANTDRFFADVQRGIEALPGVAAVGQTSAPPTVDWHLRSSYDVDWMPRTTHQDAVNVEDRSIDGNYLKAMGIPLLAGREFRATDGPMVLVNQEFVRRFLPGGNPVGHRLLSKQSLEIVGVVGDVRGTAGSIAGEIKPEVYFLANGLTSRWFVVRSSLPPEELTKTIRVAIHTIDPGQAISQVGTMKERIGQAVAEPRLNMALLVSFAAIALTLACVGIYGVVAYSVAQRRQEIGVRMALGASRAQISMLFLKRTLASALIGLACGGAATLLLTRLLRSQLYGVQPNDPATFLIATLLLLAPVFAASLRPALRAAAVDPMEALRTE